MFWGHREKKDYSPNILKFDQRVMKNFDSDDDLTSRDGVNIIAILFKNKYVLLYK